MHPLYLQIPTSLGFLLQTASTWAEVFTPWIIAIICVIALIIMAVVPCWIKSAREIDEIMDFRNPNRKLERNHNQNERTSNERNVTPNKA